MKKLLLLILLFFILVPYVNAEENNFGKKNVLLGVGLTILLPGAGFIYTENEAYASLYTALELGLLSLAALKSIESVTAYENIKANSIKEYSFALLGIFAAVKISEIIGVINDIENYNKKFERTLNIKPQINQNKVSLSLIYKF